LCRAGGEAHGKIAQAVLAKGHDFAVEDDTVDPQPGQRLGDRAKLAGPIIGLAREHRRVLAFEMRLRAIAVPLDSMRPFRAGRRLGHAVRFDHLDEAGLDRTAHDRGGAMLQGAAATDDLRAMISRCLTPNRSRSSFATGARLKFPAVFVVICRE